MFRQPTVLTVLLVLCAPVCWSAQPAADDTGKPTNEGKPVLALTIRCDVENLKVGDEIPITFVVANGGKIPYEYMDPVGYDRSGRMSAFKLVALDDQDNAVPDPRAKLGWGRGGGPVRKAALAPGESFTRSIALNLWVRMTKPGKYKVLGTYYARSLKEHIRSAPVWITVHPRTDLEMANYIKKVSRQMAATTEDNAHADLICKLMYTQDKRVVPAIIDGMYKSVPSSQRVLQAFRYYLPHDQSMIDALLAEAEKCGLANGMVGLLRSRGCMTEQIKSLIEVSLSPQNRDAWRYGAMAAETNPDDRFTARLIAIANDFRSGAQDQAIHSLAVNRTDESVAALKQLLRSADESTRRSVEHAIRSAYRYQRNGPGRALRDDDFDSVYRKVE